MEKDIESKTMLELYRSKRNMGDEGIAANKKPARFFEKVIKI